MTSLTHFVNPNMTEEELRNCECFVYKAPVIPKPDLEEMEDNIYMFLYRIRIPLEIQLMNNILFGANGASDG